MTRSWRRTRREEATRVRRSFLVVFVLLAALALGQSAGAQETVRVGVYNNPPKVTVSEAGEVAGFFPELVEVIAGQNGWLIEYIPGSWTESLSRLVDGEIDLMVDVAVTPARKELYAFNQETILVNWGTVYTSAALSILSLPELEGLRIAVMTGSTHTEDPGAIKDLVDQFGIQASFVEKENYTGVFEAIRSGEADAGVTNRIFGLAFEDAYGVQRTPIVFNPSELRFALPPHGDLTPSLIADIDVSLAQLKSTPDSTYYRLLEEHLLDIPKRETVIRWPAWLVPAFLFAAVLIVGLLIGFLVVRREIRNRQVAERAHHLSDERFELAMQGANDGLWDWNIATDSVYYSPRWAYMLGYKADELEPSIDAFHRLIHPDDLERVIREESDYLAGKSPRYQIEFRMLHRDGIYIDVLSRAFVVRDEEGTPIRMVGTHVDISERKYAEETMREREAYLRTIINHMPVDFFAIDRNLTYTMQSPTSIQAIGHVIGQRADEINVPDNLRQAWLDELDRVFQGETVRQEYDVTTVTGERRTYLSNVAPVRVAGSIIAAIGTSLDITVRKQAADELRDAKEKAETADQLKSAFLATMSHELRTPLNSIIGFTGILLQELPGQLNEEQRKQLSMVQTSARHLLDLINDVLDISKIEADQLVVELSAFNLSDLLREIAAAAEPFAREKALDVTLEIGEEISEMYSDRRRVGQIVTNLLSNATKFTESGGIRLACREHSGVISISVTDTGIGISQADVEKLFVPFQQVDTGLTRRYDGTGLGLSISRRLSEKLGGTIDVQSELGRGSTFTVRLPKELR